MYIKAHPIARRAEQRAVPCAPRLSRALCNSHESKIVIRAQTVLAHNPGLSCGARRARLAPGRGEKRRGFRRLRGVLSLGYLSLHEQRKVTRRRAASGNIAFQASPQAIQQEAGQSTGCAASALRLKIHE